LYYTKDSKKPRIEADPKYYDKFLQTYFYLKTKQLRVSVKELCADKDLQISRASVYRHLLTPNGAKEIELLSYIRFWILKNLGIDYVATVVKRQLKIEYMRRKSTLRVKF
jgi:hypothetical protein